MRQMIFLLLFICYGWVLKAQEFSGLNIPRSRATSTGDIAAYIISHFDTERSKALAAYSWVTGNIRYSKDSANLINSDLNPGARITVAFRRRKGVCENFSAIFNDICLKSGLSSFVVSGYTKQSGTVDRTGHSWCAVSINKTWYLCDPTWDEGNGLNAKYFLVQPVDFIESHMPFDPLWQLLNYPVTHEQFYSGNLAKKNNAPYFSFPDSVAAYMQMDSLHRLQSTALRIQKYKLPNSLVKDNYNYIKMNIEIINQDKDLELYNSSMTDLNDATTILNNFIEYRNNQFIPEKTDAELQALLDGIDTRLDSSLKKLDKVDKSEATLTLGTDQVRNRLQALLNKIKGQKDFLTQYLRTEKINRKSLFY